MDKDMLRILPAPAAPAACGYIAGDSILV